MFKKLLLAYRIGQVRDGLFAHKSNNWEHNQNKVDCCFHVSKKALSNALKQALRGKSGYVKTGKDPQLFLTTPWISMELHRFTLADNLVQNADCKSPEGVTCLTSVCLSSTMHTYGSY